MVKLLLLTHDNLGGKTGKFDLCLKQSDENIIKVPWGERAILTYEGTLQDH